MKFLEKNLEDIIFETDNEKLQERGLDIKGKKFRQLKLSHYGIADIITVSRVGQSLQIDIFELKKDVINADTLIQALRYLEGIKTYLRKRKFKKNVYYTIRLCGKSISNLRELSLLSSNIGTVEMIELITYSYDFNGLRFEENYEHISDSFGEKISFEDVLSKKKEDETFHPF